MKKRIGSLLLILALCFTLLPTAVLAADSSKISITTVDELLQFAKAVDNGEYDDKTDAVVSLDADLDLTNVAWKPIGTDVYFNELTAELVGLIKAASGHALVLFTSYAAMSAVKERLWEESLPFPLLTLGRNAPHIIEQFRHTPGAVLLATGAAWEGFDFPGDCVSLLIIPRLPFAYPDARKERELEKYPSLHAFIREVAVPEMQIKLRQGFGRAIRTESDTCVIAILDERACRGRRYAQAVSEALPEMRRTGSLREVTRFLREKKPESYFEVGR